MGFFGTAHGLGGGEGGRGGLGFLASLPKICHTMSYNDETWHSYTLPKEDPKNV